MSSEPVPILALSLSKGDGLKLRLFGDDVAERRALERARRHRFTLPERGDPGGEEIVQRHRIGFHQGEHRYLDDLDARVLEPLAARGPRGAARLAGDIDRDEALAGPERDVRGDARVA